MRRLATAGVLVLALAGCESVPGSSNVRLDTLGGYQLGALLPDVRAQAEKEGRLLDCSDQPDNEVYCWEMVASLADRDALSLSFDGNGRLSHISLEPGEDWERVSLESLLVRLRPYGRVPEPEYTDSMLVWSAARGGHVFGLLCIQGRGARCSLSVSAVEE